MYDVEFTTAAARQVRRLDPQARRRLLAGVAKLAVDPRPAGVKKLAGEENAWRIRVGDYRILYEAYDSQLLVVVVAVGHRREVYKKR
ncbi:MAG: type II toxin-antitoxin system RelE/ParE family toxin [Microlunatus sp.]|nr:type II toxin-antitoxin system RelE/ParE family toxin [Microlunatus sp.]